MDETIKKIKKFILKDSNKRVLVLGTIGSGIDTIYKRLKIGEWYEQVFDDLLIENFGYIDIKYIKKEEQNRIKNTIKIKKGKPLFGYKIIESDIIIFLYVDPIILKLKCLIDGLSYYQASNIQNKLIKSLKDVNVPIIKIDNYPKDFEPLKSKRNVYICDNENEHSITDKKELLNDDDGMLLRFPYIKKVSKIDDLKRKQGFMLIINEDYLTVKNVIAIDKKYRSLFCQFNRVYIITKDIVKIKMFSLKYTNIYFVDKDYFDDETLMRIYYDYLLNLNKVKFSKKKLKMLEKFSSYFKTKEEVSTKEISCKFSMSIRNVERYMGDYNLMYHSIGYDYCKNVWYIIH